MRYFDYVFSFRCPSKTASLEKRNYNANLVITIMTMIGRVNNVPVKNNVLRRSYEIEWKIPNFSKLSVESCTYYHSPQFSFDEKSWYLRIYPNGHPQMKSVGCIGLYLFLQKNCFNISIRIEFTLGLKKYMEKNFQSNITNIPLRMMMLDMGFVVASVDRNFLMKSLIFCLMMSWLYFVILSILKLLKHQVSIKFLSWKILDCYYKHKDLHIEVKTKYM